MTDYLSELVWEKSNSPLSRKEWIKNIWNEFEKLYPIRITKASFPSTIEDYKNLKSHRNGSNDFIDYLKGLPSQLEFPFFYDDILQCWKIIGADTNRTDEFQMKNFDFWYWHCLVYALIQIGEEEKIEGRFLGKWKENE